MAGNTDYRVNATNGTSRPTPLSDRKGRRKKEPSKQKKHSTPKAEADEHTDSAAEGTETKTDPNHVVDYYA